jgi:hypothetical protein
MYGIYFGNTEELQSKTEILQRCRWVQQSLPDLHHALPMLPSSENIANADAYAQELKLEYAIRQFEVELETMSIATCPICAKTSVCAGILGAPLFTKSFRYRAINYESPEKAKNLVLSS